MTAKEYLEQIQDLDIKIKHKQEKAKKIKESLYASGINYENIGEGKSDVSGDNLGAAMAEVVDYFKEIREDTENLVILRIKADKYIQELKNEKEQHVLERRYLFYESLEKIADDMGACRRSIYNYHKKGLKNISIPDLVR
jgi:DNA-directed RNA polymerase specialized sigma subunit